MDLSFRSVATAGEIIYTEVTLCWDDSHESRIRIPADTVKAWQGSFVVLALSEDESLGQTLEQLVSSVEQILTCYSHDMHDRATYINLVRGLFDFLGRQEGSELRTRFPQAYSALQAFLFNFRACREMPQYIMEFRLEGESIFHYGVPTLDYDWHGVPKSVCSVFIRRKHQAHLEQRRQGASRTSPIERILADHEHFCAVVEAADDFTRRSFVNFSKALVEFWEQERAAFGLYEMSIPDVCAFIVKNETDSLEEQKAYLNRILGCEESEADKLDRLNSIVEGVREETQHAQDPHHAALGTLVSLIAGHYLRVYNLEQVVLFWKKAEHKDWLLRFLLSLYRAPGRYLAASGMVFLLLAGLSWMGSRDSLTWPGAQESVLLSPLRPASTWAGVKLMGCVYLAIVALIVWMGYVLFRRRRLHYTQLFLPRLLGASVVGLTVLVLEPAAWDLAMRSSLVNIGLISFLAYALSFAYVFFDVYGTTVLLPHWHEIKKDVVGSAARTSLKVFSIALVETFFVVLIASTLVFPGMNLGLTNDSIGGIIASPARGIAFGFFPVLVVLWTGLTLFIGSFVQLLWQDTRITA